MEELELQHVIDRKRWAGTCGLRLSLALVLLRRPCFGATSPLSTLLPCRGELQEVASRAGSSWLAPTTGTEQGTEQVRDGGAEQERAKG